MSETESKAADVRAALLNRYERALASLFSGGGESALQEAYEIGRSAVAENVGLLEMAQLHHTALEKHLAADVPAEKLRQRRAEALAFFAESLAPQEMACRALREASVILRHFNDLLEQQAQRIAHSIHDEAGQLLVAVHLELAELAREIPPESRQRLPQVTELLNRIEEELRNLAHELRPTMLDDLGLPAALEFLVATVSKRAGIRIDLESDLQRRLPAPLETVIYRIVQEALNNVRKHSQAKQAWVRIGQENGTIHCCIRDNGVGFDTSAAPAGDAQRGLGLMGIVERLRAVGGSLEIRSTAGSGTDLQIKLPMEV